MYLIADGGISTKNTLVNTKGAIALSINTNYIDGISLNVAYTKDEGEEVSMSDVNKSSDKQAEARRQAKLQKEREERNQNNRYNKNRKPRTVKEEKKEVVEENTSNEVVTPVENNSSDENK